MSEELILLIVEKAFMAGIAKIEWNKVAEKVKGVPADKIPDVLDALYAEASANLDAAIKKVEGS